MLIRQGPIIAHRGASQRAPENTMAAFRQAYQAGASSTELDVGLSSDGEFFVLHDDTLERTTNGQGRLDQTSSEKLAGLDAGSWFSPAFAGERVPKLADVLDWARDRMHLTIEMKSSTDQPGTAEKLVAMLAERGMTEQVSVISFASPLVHKVESLAPEIDTGLLLSERPTLGHIAAGAKIGAGLGLLTGLTAGLTGAWSALGCLAWAAGCTALGALAGKSVSSHRNSKAAAGVGVDAVMPFWIDADKRLVRTAANHGKKVVAYTANHPSLVSRLLGNGVAGVITDTPEQFCQPRVL